MVVDSSALLQILFAEPDADRAARTLAEASNVVVAAPALLETEIVFGARAGFETGEVGELIARLGIEVVPFDARHAAEAKRAYARFGKGSGHPARLNFGDCASYALAKTLGKPLAFKGNDFGHTDLEVVATDGEA